MTNEQLRELRGEVFRAVSISRVIAVLAEIGVTVVFRSGVIVDLVKHSSPQDYGRIKYTISHDFGSDFAKAGSVEAHTDLELREQLQRMAIKLIEEIISGVAPR